MQVDNNLVSFFFFFWITVDIQAPYQDLNPSAFGQSYCLPYHWANALRANNNLVSETDMADDQRYQHLEQ